MEVSREILEKVCSIRRSFDELIERHQDDTELADSVRSALDTAGFPPEEKIRQDYEKSAESARLLRIGIVGAVKAGKSSLINSVFFDGQDILPKAATPMTAALTEMTFGKECSVTVDFFTDEDIDGLRKKSAEYERRFFEAKNKKSEELEANWLKAQRRRDPAFAGEPRSEEREQWESAAERAARNKMQENISLCGAWDQYRLIMKSAIHRKTGSETLKAESVSEIAGLLGDYVGAQGKYMPFASRVSVSLPMESLRGIAIVDTPGFNDPVASRDERARQALRECDVIFILSRATPFLSKPDVEVISKITRKEGLRELFIVPSQTDSSLVAPEIMSESDHDMYAALVCIKEILNGVVSKSLSGINDDGVFDRLISEAPERMFLVSGICSAMARTFSERERWDSGKKTVWQNLCECYPDFFSESDAETSAASLERLGNTGKIRSCIADVKARKAEIFRDRLAQFGGRYLTASKEAADSIVRELEAREAYIMKNDISGAEDLIDRLQQSYDTIAPELEDVFLDDVSDWYDEVRSAAMDVLSGSHSDVKSAIRAQEGEVTYVWVSRPPLWKFWASETEHRETRTAVRASAVKNAIDEYIGNFNDNLPHFFNEQIRRLIKKVTGSVMKIWAESGADPDGTSAALRNRVRSAVSGIVREYDLEYRGSKFSYDGGSAMLEGRAAEDFIGQAGDFVSMLNRTFREMLNNAAEDVYRQFRKCDFSKSVLDPYLRQLEKKKEDLKKPRLALENLRRMKEEVRAIK